MSSTRKEKMCCLVNPSLTIEGCTCGRRVCHDCKLEILNGVKTAGDKRRQSKYWPKSFLNLLADHHYRYDKTCGVVKNYIRDYGEPVLETQTSI